FGLPATGPGGANSQLTNLMFGPGVGMGQYQDFGDIHLDFAASGIVADQVAGYVRDLDLETAVSSVSFEHDGVAHRREYFVSHPDQVAVVRLSASEPGSLSFTTTAQGSAGLTTAATADAGAQRITLSGEVEDNQLRAE